MILHVKSGGNWVHYIENSLYWSFSLLQDDADIHNINRLSIQMKALSVRMVVQVLDYPVHDPNDTIPSEMKLDFLGFVLITAL